MKVFAMSGSLRTGSWNTKLLNLAVPLLREKGVEVDVFDFRAANVPVYDPDTSEQQYPAQVTDAKERIRAADGFLLVSPEYNNGIPGALKNFIDFVSRPPREQPWRGKVVAHLGATPGGFATLYAQAQIRQVFNSLAAWSLPGHFVISKAPEAFDDAGHLKDAARMAELDKFLSRYVEALT
ncbi:MAG: NADPH-dependent oxidoreductase [Archangium gephyra]|uniref:NADPH-dependent oxidoreductase n=1 Tax=Archangium gephyra TaxID=48 RepID=A0A2W5SMA0_9BACT|nr:MAG: NADPH-dependent oxidoreductase [Archangium gephyra]